MNRNRYDDNKAKFAARINKDPDRGVKHRCDKRDEFKRNKNANNPQLLKCRPLDPASKNSANKRLQCYRQYLQENKIQHKHMLPSTDVACKNNNNDDDKKQPTAPRNVDSINKIDGVQNRLRTPNLPHRRFETVVADEDTEEMDWEPLDDSTVLSEIQVLRQVMDPNESFKSLSSPFSAMVNTECENTSTKNSYIVVDTNIFMSGLHVIQEILNESNKIADSLVILVPWMVTQELDYLKEKHSNHSVQRSAMKAVKFINNCLVSKNPRLKGQNVSDALQYKYSSGNADDSILFCCLQVKERGNNVALLTNDLNLKNKALINEVPAYNKDEIIQHLRHSDSSALAIKNKTTEVKQQLSYLYSYIVIKEMMSAYGETWQVITKIDTSSPLSFEECLKLIEKYWMPVFSIHLQKQCLKTVQEIKKILNEGSRITRNDFLKFKELVMGLCLYFRNAYDVYCASVEKCARSIEEICQGV